MLFFFFNEKQPSICVIGLVRGLLGEEIRFKTTFDIQRNSDKLRLPIQAARRLWCIVISFKLPSFGFHCKERKLSVVPYLSERKH